MADVSVVIPCYNYARYLTECVKSVLTQEGVTVSVCIIDDCSSDDTRAVGRRLAALDARVELVAHDVNRGHIATYNEGILAATGRYVVLLSADDLLTPGALRRACELMDANPSVGFVYGHPLAFADDLPRPRTGRADWTIWNGRDWIRTMCRSGQNFIHCPEVVMRTSVQHRIGGYNASLPHSGDMEMWLRAAAVSDVGRLNGVDQAFYRRHPLSMQRTVHAGLLYDIKGRLAAFNSALGGAELPEAEALLALAHRSLATEALRHVLDARAAAWPLVEPEQDYRDAALQIFPGIEASKEWRALAEGEPLPRRRLSVAAARLRIGMARRLEWIYWRRKGIHRPVRPVTMPREQGSGEGRTGPGLRTAG